MTTRDNAPLGKRILGFQHFGLTVQNMDRAYAFYTDVLGGTEVMRDGDFHGEKIQNTLMLNDEIEAHEKKINPATNGVPDLRNGEQRLDVRFITERARVPRCPPQGGRSWKLWCKRSWQSTY